MRDAIPTYLLSPLILPKISLHTTGTTSAAADTSLRRLSDSREVLEGRSNPRERYHLAIYLFPYSQRLGIEIATSKVTGCTQLLRKIHKRKHHNLEPHIPIRPRGGLLAIDKLIVYS